MSYDIVLFDLDGTLLDTTTDLAISLNHAMHALGHQSCFTPHDAAHFFGSGSTIACARAFAALEGASLNTLLALGDSTTAQDLGLDMHKIEQLNKAFSAHYQLHSNDHTLPYPGICDMLAALQGANIPCAVVSNKMDSEVKRLSKLHFGDIMASATGLSPTIARKPAADTTLIALHELQAKINNPNAQAVYIGDTEIDLLTAHNASLDCIAVDWGFREHSYLEHCGAKHIVSSASELTRAILETK